MEKSTVRTVAKLLHRLRGGTMKPSREFLVNCKEVCKQWQRKT